MLFDERYEPLQNSAAEGVQCMYVASDFSCTLPRSCVLVISGWSYMRFGDHSSR